MLSFRLWLLAATTTYQAIACGLEDRQPPPGQLIDVDGYRLHLYRMGQGSPTIVLDHSLGGVEGYLLIEALAQLAPVCIYDRAGYGWSDQSPQPRTSQNIVQDLNTLLTRANIPPPYLLIGNSFGSYNVRLYAHQFPEKVMGLVLTDGLHETGMLNLPVPLKVLKLLFTAGFMMSVLGAAFGIIRLLSLLRVFEVLKPELRQFASPARLAVKRSFYRPKHWVTMTREMVHLYRSGQQLSQTQPLDALPIVSIKAKSFFKPAWWTFLLPLYSANRLRDQMHAQISGLSKNCTVLHAHASSHFVWIDQPDLIVQAARSILETVASPGSD